MTATGDLPSILQTKLFRAPLSEDHVHRPHLLERLQQVKQRPLTIVSAPAGYGKSVLLSSWSQQCDGHSAWLSLDENDNDQGSFEGYFLAALQSVIPSLGQGLMEAIAGARVPPTPVFVEILFRELGQIENDIVLMFDDYGVITSDDVHQLITELMQHPHPKLHLVLGTRYDPPLPLNEWRARNQVVEIRTADMRFSLEETRRFLQRALDAQLEEETIVALNKKTEGWIAGLRLAALSLSHVEGLPGRIDELSSSNVYIRDYLANQVLTHLPAETQIFLLQTSILDRLSASLCQAVIMLEGPIVNTQATLLELEAANIFMIPLDDSQQWFRYHHLFGEFLQMRLNEGYSVEIVAELHRRASAWFVGHGFTEEALQHALAGGDIEAAVEIVAANRNELINQESYRRLSRWLQMFPREIIEESPDLLLIDAHFAQTVRFDIVELHQLVGKIDALLEHLDLEPQKAQLLLAENNAFRGAALFYMDAQASLASNRKALEIMPQIWYVQRNYCRVYGAVALQFMGDFRGLSSWIEQGRREDLAVSDGPRTRNALAEQIVCWIAANLAALENIGEFVLENTKDSHWETRGWANHYLASVYYQRNDLDRAQQHAQQTFSNRYYYPTANVDSAFILVMVLQAKGKPEEAREMLKTALDFATEMRSMPFTFLAQSFQVELAVIQGQAHEHIQWAEQAYAQLQLTPMYSFYTPQLTIAKVLLAAGTVDGRRLAADCLRQLHEYSESTHHTRVLIEVLALEALLHAAEHDEEAALTALEESLALARPGGFVRLYVDLGPEMANLLQRLQNRSPNVDYIDSILTAFVEDSQLVSQSNGNEQLIEPLTDRELEILGYLERRFDNREIAAELVIAHSTVKRHTINIYQKLNVHSRSEAVEAARNLGILPLPK
jgi:LuxR family maltose regulon positive regulatory protein